MAPPKESPYRLMVEGPDDQHSVIKLLARHGYDWDDTSSLRPHVYPAQGIAPLFDALPVAVKSFKRLGVVIDADLSLANRWASIRDRFAGLGFAMPSDPDSTGLVVDRSDGVRIGVWLMPNNQQPGILEDFLATLIPNADPCWAHAGTSTTSACGMGAPLQAKDLSKGTIHT